MVREKMRKKHMVIFVPNVYFPFIGGISTATYYLEKFSRLHGLDTKVIPFPSKFILIEQKVRNRYLRRVVHSIFVISFIIYSELIIFGKRLRYKKVIVHSQSASFCFIIAAISKLFGCRVVHTFRSELFREKPMKDFRKRYYDFFLSKLDVITFVSAHLRREIEKQMQIKSKAKNIVIRTAIDTDKYNTNVDGSWVRKRHNVGSHMILFVGNLVENKGILVLIDAVKIVKNETPEVSLVVVGKGPLEQKIEVKSKELGLDENIVLVGKVPYDQIAYYFAACDVFVLPSFGEGLPQSVLEAMATGKAVVATNIPAISEIIEDRVNGFLVPIGGVKELAETIIRALKGYDADKIATNALRTVREKHSWKEIFPEYLKVYGVEGNV